MTEKHTAQAAPLLQPPPPPPQPFYGVPDSYRDPSPAAYILLPAFPRRRRRPCRCCGSLLSSSSLLTLAFFAAVLAASLFFLWPADPELSVARLRLDRIRIRIDPIASLDISIGLEVRVRNLDFFSLDYDKIVVAIGYRGRKLGVVTSAGGHVRARGTSYVEANLHLNGIQILTDVFYLIEDLAKGSIPLDTTTEIDGQLHFFFLDIPIQWRISCAVHVNPNNQTIVRQDCYPDY